MSAMKELYLKVAADAVLQEKVSRIFEIAEKDADGAGKKLVAFAREQGYEVTVEEIDEFFGSMAEKSNEQLSEEELEAVAGGKGGEGVIVDSSLINANACK